MKKRYIYKNILTPYIIYDDGRVYDEHRCEFRTPYKNKAGYCYIDLKIPEFDKPVKRAVHQLVAETFIPNPNNLPTVNHIDGNKDKNCVSNLEWMSYSDNNLHAYQTGLHKPLPPEKVTFTKYTIDQVELACRLIEKNKNSLAEIEVITGIPQKTLSEIRCGSTWKSISKKYKFPKKKIKATKVIDYETHVKIVNLIEKEFTNEEIYKKLGIEKTKRISKYMDSYRYHNITKMKVQRPSKMLILDFTAEVE